MKNLYFGKTAVIKLTGLLALVLLVVNLAPARSVFAANFIVTKTADTNDGVCDADCSLREAIGAANALAGADTITFATTLDGTPIMLSIAGRLENSNVTGDLDISGDLTIHGNGARATIIDANGIDRVVDVHPGITVIINDVTIQNGNANQAVNDGTLGTTGEDGGGIRASGGTTSLTINDSRITGNHAYDDGGAVSTNTASTTISINRSLIDNNSAIGSATDNGGGLFAYPAGNIAGNNTTISNNRSGNGGNGGAAFVQGGVITLNNTTVTGNSDPTGGNAGLAAASGGTFVLVNNIISNNNPTDCTTFGGFGTITSNGYNVVGSNGSANGCPTSGIGDQILAGATSTLLNTTLADNGGPTDTHALFVGSQAIDVGNNAVCAATPINGLDQRGVPRPQGAACDIGAYEYVALVIPSANGGNGPGGVGVTNGSSNLELWLRADKGIFSNAICTTQGSDGNASGCWQDQSGNNLHFTNNIGANQPVYELTETGMNNQPSLQFSADRLSHINFPALTNINDYAVYAVGAHAGDGNTFIGGVQTGNTGHGLQLTSWNGGDDIRFLHRMPFSGSGGNDLITNNNAHTTNTPHMLTAIRNLSGSTQNVRLNGGTPTSLTPTAAVFSSNLDMAVGNRSGGANSGHTLTGYMGEVIIFAEAPADVRRLLVENYLSAKYAIALSANDVYDGDTNGNGDFDLDVAGIGQFGGSQHTQAFAAGMAVVNGSFLNNNGDWLLFGHKTAVNSNVTTDLPTTGDWASAASPQRWDRHWYIDVTDAGATGGTVDIIFDFSEAGMGNGKPPSNPASNYRLLKRSGTTGSFSDIAVATAVSGDQVQFQNVDVSLLGSNFTLGTLDEQDSPTAVSLQSFSANPMMPLALVGMGLLMMLLTAVVVSRKR